MQNSYTKNLLTPRSKEMLKLFHLNLTFSVQKFAVAILMLLKTQLKIETNMSGLIGSEEKTISQVHKLSKR